MTLFQSIQQAFVKEAQQNQALFVQTLQDMKTIIHEEEMVFRNQPLPFSVQPLAISVEENEYFKKATELLSDAMERLLDAYLADPEITEFFAYYKKYEPLIRIDPRYKRKIRISRFDCIWGGGNEFKVVEPNTCCPGGVVVLGKLKERWQNLQMIQRVTQDYRMDSFLCDTPQGFIGELLAAYRETGGEQEFPNIALVNYDGLFSYELSHMQKYMIESGLQAVICDLRDLKLQGETLYHKDLPVDILYHKVDQLQLGGEDMADVIEAIKQGWVCSVNSYASMFIGESKMTLALLSDPNFQTKYLTAEQIEMIDRHVPWTRKLESVRTGYQGERIDLVEFSKSNKDSLVLKIDNAIRGENVFLGRFTEQGVWNDLIDTNCGQNWIVQEYFQIPEVELLVHEAGELNTRNKRFGIDMFMFGGKYAGAVSRISDKHVINLGQGRYEQPVILLAPVREGARM